MRQVLTVDPDEACYWLREEVVNSPELGIPVRVQHLVVRRDGELVMHSTPIMDGIGPPLEFDTGQMSVAWARETAEGIRSRPRSNPPPITVNLGGETYVDAEHPALEGIPDGNANGHSRG